MEQFADAEQKLSDIFHYGHKVGGYIKEAIDEVKELYALKMKIREIISYKAHYHLYELLESLIAEFVEKVNLSFEMISPNFSLLENNGISML